MHLFCRRSRCSMQGSCSQRTGWILAAFARNFTTTRRRNVCQSGRELRNHMRCRHCEDEHLLLRRGSTRWKQELRHLLPNGFHPLRFFSLLAPLFLVLTYGVCLTNTARHVPPPLSFVRRVVSILYCTASYIERACEYTTARYTKCGQRVACFVETLGWTAAS